MAAAIEVIIVLLMTLGVSLSMKEFMDIIILLRDFYKLTSGRCTEEDLNKAAKSFSTAVAKLSVVGFMILLNRLASAGFRAKIRNKLKEAKSSGEGGKDANLADNIADYSRLKKQLAFDEASSAFTNSGKLKSQIINSSDEIIHGSQLKNQKLIQNLTKDGSNINDWGKYTTESINSPSGKFQVHFYKNRKTGKIFYDYDYKIKFNSKR